MTRRFKLTWNKANHGTGIEAIDAEHRALFDHVNRIADAITREDCAAAETLMKEFIQFTRDHFAHEERLMATHGFPDWQGHKAEHDAMLQKLGNLSQVCRLPRAAKEPLILAFLTDWVEKHILEADKEIGAFLASKGLR